MIRNVFQEKVIHNHCSMSSSFPINDARFSKMKNIPDHLSDERKGRIIENIDFKDLSNRASFMGNTVFVFKKQ